MNIEVRKTERGFAVVNFVDLYGASCSLQESSLATDSAIWFGTDNANPQVFIEGQGWVPLEVPAEAQFYTRMHLSQAKMKELLPHLTAFAATGTMTSTAQHVEVYDSYAMEGALCAWEWMVENRDHDLISKLYDDLGTSAMRSCAIRAGAICVAVYDHMDKEDYEFLSSYDWEFVPAVLLRIDWKALTEHDQHGGPAYEPDIAAIFEDILDKNGSDFAKRDRKAEWISSAKAVANRLWNYPELINDHPERVEAACSANEDPAEFVKWLGEHYGLTPAGDW